MSYALTYVSMYSCLFFLTPSMQKTRDFDNKVDKVCGFYEILIIPAVEGLIKKYEEIRYASFIT